MGMILHYKYTIKRTHKVGDVNVFRQTNVCMAWDGSYLCNGCEIFKPLSVYMTEGECRAFLSLAPVPFSASLETSKQNRAAANEEATMQKRSLSGHDHYPGGRHIEKDVPGQSRFGSRSM